MHIPANPEQHIAWLQSYHRMGFSHLVLHNVNQEQEPFIRVSGQSVLPALRDSR